MMNVAIMPSCASALRVQRLALWLALSVARLAAYFVEWMAPREARKLLDRYTRAVMAILLLMASRGMALRRRGGGFVSVKRRRITMRHIAGAMLRRVLRTGSLRERALALASMLAAPERWVAYITRRMRRGFTRLTPLPPPRSSRVALLAFAPLIAPAINSS